MAASSSADLAQSLGDVASELPAEIASAVTKFAAAADDIQVLVRRLQLAPWAQLCEGLAPLESARLHLMVAYTVNTLFYSAPCRSHAARSPTPRPTTRLTTHARKALHKPLLYLVLLVRSVP